MNKETLSNLNSTLYADGPYLSASPAPTNSNFKFFREHQSEVQKIVSSENKKLKKNLLPLLISLHKELINRPQEEAHFSRVDQYLDTTLNENGLIHLKQQLIK